MTDDQPPQSDIEIVGLDCQAGQHAECKHRWPVYLLIQEQARGRVQTRSALCVCWCHREQEGA